MPPLLIARVSPGGSHAGAVDASQEPAAVGRRRRIAFIDDDRDVRLRVLCALADAGMDAYVAGCDSVNPSTVVAWRPDVIVINPVDHATSKRPFAVVRSLREERVLRQVPLVVVIDPLTPPQFEAELDELAPAAKLALARREPASGSPSAAAQGSRRGSGPRKSLDARIAPSPGYPDVSSRQTVRRDRVTKRMPEA